MKVKKQSKLEGYRKNFASIVVALLCLYNVYMSWGESWVLVSVFTAGVLVCGTFAWYDLKRMLQQRQVKS